MIVDAAASAILNDQGPAAWQMPIGAPAQLAGMFEQLVAQRLSALYEPLSLWWTDGSAIVEPSVLIAKGLPHPDSFAALLDGAWTQHHWQSVPAYIDGPAVEPDTLLTDDPTPPRFRSAGIDRRGPGPGNQPGRVPRAAGRRTLGGRRRARWP